MRIIDTWILWRFTANFLLLFSVLFVFGVSIDVVLQMDEFRHAAEALWGSSGLWSTGMVILQFHGPRAFQMFQYMAPLIAVGAAGFTLASMHRNRELVALMSAGLSLRRIGAPFMVAGLVIAVMQAANQEFVLPRIAVQLLRGHEEITAKATMSFPVPLWPDGRGQLLRAEAFDPGTGELKGLIAIDRDSEGRIVRRVSATSAKWSQAQSAWRLSGGVESAAQVNGVAPSAHSVDLLTSGLTPDALVLRHTKLYAHLLGLRQLTKLQAGGAVRPDELRRMAAGRFGLIAAGLLVLLASLPFFLLREPTNLLRQSAACAGFAVPAIFGSVIAMSVPIASLSPTVAVVLPIAILLPLAVWRLSALRT